VAFGVLLDTFVVRSLLVPAAAYDIGRAIWWPSKLWRAGVEVDEGRTRRHEPESTPREPGRSVT